MSIMRGVQVRTIKSYPQRRYELSTGGVFLVRGDLRSRD